MLRSEEGTDWVGRGCSGLRAWLWFDGVARWVWCGVWGVWWCLLGGGAGGFWLLDLCGCLWLVMYVVLIWSCA